MSRSLLEDIKKNQMFIVISFSLVVFLLTGVLLWWETFKPIRERLLILNRMITLAVVKHWPSTVTVDEKIIKLKLEPRIRDLIQCYPREYTAGFYSRELDRVVVGVSNDPMVNVEGATLPRNDSGLKSWLSQKPEYGLNWSPIRRTWILKCDYPVIIKGRILGHSFANITLSRVFLVYGSAFTILLIIIAAAGYLSILTSRWASRKITTNVNRLLLVNENQDETVFDYEEFECIARLNRLAYQKAGNILESITDAFFTLDHEWRFTYLNKEAEHLWTINAEMLLGKVIWEAHPYSKESLLYRQLHKAVSEQISLHFEAFSPGILKWIELHIYPSADGLSVYFRDITQKKHFEDELRAERERLQITLNSISDGVIATDRKGNIILMNKAAEDLTGWPNPDWKNQPVNKVLYIIDDKTSEVYEDLTGYISNFDETQYLRDTILVNKELKEIPVAISCTPIKPVQGDYSGAVFVFQDITEKMKTESELLKTQKLESLGILAGGIAHDFNNILAAILANLQLAIIKLNKGTDIRKYLTEMVEITHKASELTKQLLTFSRGGAPVKKAASIIELIQDTAQFALRGSKAGLKFAVPKDLWPVEVDEGQISQVIHNLVINAKQAMLRGGEIEIEAENYFIEFGARFNPGKYVRIAVRDQGIGIPKENLNKIFDPFFTTKKEGSGLGLATSYSIIHRHDGYLEVESEVNVGSTFYIYLPASTTIVKPDDTEKILAVAAEGVKILLMDDEEIILQSVGEMLEYSGFRVTLARDGSEAIKHYQEALISGDQFDAVIMDLTVPGGMGGQEAVAYLRDIDPKIKAIISSGYANDPVMSDYERFGFCGVVIKPYKLEDLNAVLNRVIGKRQLRFEF